MHTTATPTREDEILRVLKRRLVKIGKMLELQKKKLSDATIRRRLKVTPAQLKLMRAEHADYNFEAGLAWRMRYRSVPKTLQRGDRKAAASVRRILRICVREERRQAREEPEKLIKPKDATLLQPLSRNLAIRCMIDEPARWDAL